LQPLSGDPALAGRARTKVQTALSGGRLVISSTLAPQPRRLFEVAGMDRTLPLADD